MKQLSGLSVICNFSLRLFIEILVKGHQYTAKDSEYGKDSKNDSKSQSLSLFVVVGRRETFDLGVFEISTGYVIATLDKRFHNHSYISGLRT